MWNRFLRFKIRVTTADVFKFKIFLRSSSLQRKLIRRNSTRLLSWHRAHENSLKTTFNKLRVATSSLKRWWFITIKKSNSFSWCNPALWVSLLSAGSPMFLLFLLCRRWCQSLFYRKWNSNYCEKMKEDFVDEEIKQNSSELAMNVHEI